MSQVMLEQVMLEDADSQLARLVEQASRGEEVIILRGSTPVAKIVPLSEEKPEEQAGGEPVSHFGNAKGLIHLADDSYGPLELKIEEKPQERQGGFGSGKYALIYMADDFDAPLEDFEDYM